MRNRVLPAAAVLVLAVALPAEAQQPAPPQAPPPPPPQAQPPMPPQAPRPTPPQAQPPTPPQAQPPMPPQAQPPMAVQPAPQAAPQPTAPAQPTAGAPQRGAASDCLAALREFEREALQSGVGTPPEGAARVAGEVSIYGRPLTVRQQLRQLATAAQILGEQGNQEACMAVLSTMRAIYAQPVAGAAPPQVPGAPAEGVVGLPNLVTATRVIGMDVRNPAERDLGEIEDVVLDPQDSSVSYVLIERGGFLGIGEEQVAVPWRLLQMSEDGESFVLDVPEPVLATAPRVREGQFAELASPSWQQSVEAFWGQRAETPPAAGR